ncbi:IS3 family transposase [Paradesulfitobacterium aromaticivorans]
MRYPKELKNSIITKMLPPNNQSLSQIQQETGVPEGTLKLWRKEIREKGFAAPAGEQQSEQWSTRDKFLIVVETSTLSEIEFAEYCRKKGLYVEQVKSWQDNCMQANGGVAQELALAQRREKEIEKELKQVKKELQRKESALAETAALLVLRKKANAIWGKGRGGLTSTANRDIIIKLVEEAVASGANQQLACEEVGISVRTFQRWCKAVEHGSDQRPLTKRPEPANKLTEAERKEILEIVNQPEFKSLPPSEIVPILADQGTYIASESTFYRIMRQAGEQNHRGRCKAPSSKPKATHCATEPNRVWSWDITYLPGPAKGLYFYLYLILDIFSRDIVGWEVWLEESAEHASQLIRRAVMAQNITRQEEPLVLHSDNGSPMKGASMLETLYQLGITPSRSRPRVSNDNPYSESIFRTCKYRPSYPIGGFATINDARAWVKEFVHWYNYNHHHSGIKFLTPHQRHSGQGEEILKKRHQLYEAAKARHPERWTRQTRNWTLPNEVWLNPEKSQDEDRVESKTDAS